MLPVGVRHLRVAVPVIVLSLVYRSHIVGRDANAAVMTPNRLWMIGSGRPRFQTFHADLPRRQFQKVWEAS